MTYRSPSSEADQRIQAATAAVAERTRLRQRRAGLHADVEIARARVDELAATLTEEQRDVARYEGGVWAFVYGVFRSRATRVDKEQAEVAEAAARLQEAEAARDTLEQELAGLDVRLAALAGAEAEAKAARDAKQSALIAGDGPASDELREILEGLGRLDDDRKQLTEAIAAGDELTTSLDELRELLASARSAAGDDRWSDSGGRSWRTDRKIEQSRGGFGIVEARVSVFRRELADVGIAFEAENIDLDDGRLGGWLANLFTDMVSEGLDSTQQAVTRVHDVVHEKLTELRGRAAANDQRRAALRTMRDGYLDPA